MYKLYCLADAGKFSFSLFYALIFLQISALLSLCGFFAIGFSRDEKAGVIIQRKLTSLAAIFVAIAMFASLAAMGIIQLGFDFKF